MFRAFKPKKSREIHGFFKNVLLIRLKADVVFGNKSEIIISAAKFHGFCFFNEALSVKEETSVIKGEFGEGKLCFGVWGNNARKNQRIAQLF